MKTKSILFIVLLSTGLIFFQFPPDSIYAQEKGKGDLEDFADDFGEEDSDSDSGDDGLTEFFLYAFLENIGDVFRLWGGTPGTEFGPYPSFPYADGNGFMTIVDDYRSYFFNTEFSYHHLNSNLRSYLLKWETQFIGSSKLSFDLSVYEEDRIDYEYGSRYKDHITFWGFRYGYALYRTPQLILNLEGGFRGFYRNRSHVGPEVAINLKLFPQKPLIIETELAAAYVSNGPIYTVESSAGIALGRFEILGGLRILKNKSNDLLDGFRIGLRVWY